MHATWLTASRLPPLPLEHEQGILLQRYLAAITASIPTEATSSASKATTNSDVSGANGTYGTSSSSKRQIGSSINNGSTKGVKGGRDSAHTNGSTNASTANGIGNTGTSSGGAADRARLETNFYVLATACLLLANKSLRARVGLARPRRREELLRAAYGVQFRGRAVEKGTTEVLKWEGKLAAAELEVMVALGFDVQLTDPFEELHQQRKQQVGDVVVVVVVDCFTKALDRMGTGRFCPSRVPNDLCTYIPEFFSAQGFESIPDTLMFRARA